MKNRPHWGGKVGQRPTQLDDQNRKAHPRRLGRAGPPGPLFCSAQALQARRVDEIRGILLAGILSRCPTTAAPQRFWET